MKTKFAKKEDFYNGTCERAWWIVDAESKTFRAFGDKNSRYSERGKHKVIFFSSCRHRRLCDCG